MPIRILVDSEDGGLRELVSGFLLPLGKLSDCKKNRKRVGILPAKVWWGPADPQFCSSRSRTRSLGLLHRGHSTHPRTMHCQDRRPCSTSSLVQHLIVFPEGSWTGCPGAALGRMAGGPWYRPLASRCGHLVLLEGLSKGGSCLSWKLWLGSQKGMEHVLRNLLAFWKPCIFLVNLALSFSSSSQT